MMHPISRPIGVCKFLALQRWLYKERQREDDTKIQQDDDNVIESQQSLKERHQTTNDGGACRVGVNTSPYP